MNEQEKWEKVIADLQEARRILGKVDEPTFWLDYVINAVDDALVLLKAQEPRVMTLEEFNAHWQIPPQERKPIWEEWKVDNGKGKWKLYGRATGGYGDMWRCWTSRPTDEQREATPWQQ